MTYREFEQTAIAVLGTAIGWQTKIAGRLGVSSRAVRNWIAAARRGEPDAFPPWVAGALGEIAGTADLSPWPRDEWVIGDGVTADGRRREYIVHLAPPRFVARIVEFDGRSTPAAEWPVDLERGVVYQADADTLLCEIDWIDPVQPGQHVQLLEAAADAIDRQAENDDREA